MDIGAGSPNAILAGAAYVAVSADTKALFAGLAQAEGRLTRFGRTAGGIFASLGTKMLGLGAAIAAPMTMGFKKAMDYEYQLARIGTILGKEQLPWLAVYKKGIRELSQQFGVSKDDIVQSMYDILSAMVPPEKAMAMVTSSTKLAVSGFASVASSTDAIITLMEVYGSELTSTTDAADALNAAVRLGRFTNEQLGESIGTVASSAHQCGITINELLSAIATATKVGVPFDTTLTGIRTALLGLAAATPERRTEIKKKLRVDISAEAIAAKGLTGVLEKLVGLRQDDVSLIFRENRALNVMNALIQHYSTLVEYTNEIKNRAGFTEERLARTMATTKQQWKMMEQSIVTLAEVIGEAFLPAARRMVDWLTGMVKSAQEWIRTHPSFINSLLNIVKALFLVGGALIGLSAGIKVLKLLLSPFTAITVAVLLLMDVLGLLPKEWKMAMNGIRIEGLGLGTWFTVIVSEIKDIWGSLKGSLLDTWDNIIKGVNDGWDSLVTFAGLGADAWAKAFESAFSAARAGFYKFMEGLQTGMVQMARYLETGRWTSPSREERLADAETMWKKMVKPVRDIFTNQEFSGFTGPSVSPLLSDIKSEAKRRLIESETYEAKQFVKSYSPGKGMQFDQNVMRVWEDASHRVWLERVEETMKAGGKWVDVWDERMAEVSKYWSDKTAESTAIAKTKSEEFYKLPGVRTAMAMLDQRIAERNKETMEGIKTRYLATAADALHRMIDLQDVIEADLRAELASKPGREEPPLPGEEKKKTKPPSPPSPTPQLVAEVLSSYIGFSAEAAAMRPGTSAVWDTIAKNTGKTNELLSTLNDNVVGMEGKWD